MQKKKIKNKNSRRSTYILLKSVPTNELNEGLLLNRIIYWLIRIMDLLCNSIDFC